MGVSVNVCIGSSSKELIKKLALLAGADDLKELNALEHDEITRESLVSWLMRSLPHRKKSKLLLESLRVSLLKDLHESFLPPETRRKIEKKKPSNWWGKTKLVLLAIAGTVLAICEGFDAISSILNLFTSLPTMLIFTLAAVSSTLAVSVFFGFDLVEVSGNLGVKFGRSRHLLNIFMDQVEQIDIIKKDIDDCYSQTTDTVELDSLRRMIEMLNIRYKYLDEARAAYTASLKNPYLRIAKHVMAVIAGALFFCGGFFAGQSLATMIAMLFGAVVLPTFWPIILVGVIAGIAAICIYWFVQRPGLTNLVGRWVGLDREKIDVFASDEIAEDRKEGLKKLGASVALVQGMRKQISELTPSEKTPRQKFIGGPSLKPLTPSSEQTFFKRLPLRTRSLGDLCDLDQTAGFRMA